MTLNTPKNSSKWPFIGKQEHARPKKIMKKNNDFNYLGTFTLILWPNYTKDYKQ